ncbi:hypothetical protein [Peribacillus simplex]
MNIASFTADDFNVFKIDGLEPRMDALKNISSLNYKLLESNFHNNCQF